MNITLAPLTPTDDATGLTAGGNYSVYHTGRIRVTAAVGADTVVLYESEYAGGGVVLSGIPADTLTFTLTGGGGAEIELNQLA